MGVNISLTLKEYVGFWISEEKETVTIIFDDTEITMNLENFDKLKEDIIEQEE